MERIRPALAALRRRLGVLYGERLDRLLLYGSHARGEATTASDVDVMVVLREEIDPIAEIRRMGPILTDLLLETGLLVSVYPISRARFAAAESALVQTVRREGVPA